MLLLTVFCLTGFSNPHIHTLQSKAATHAKRGCAPSAWMDWCKSTVCVCYSASSFLPPPPLAMQYTIQHYYNILRYPMLPLCCFSVLSTVSPVCLYYVMHITNATSCTVWLPPHLSLSLMFCYNSFFYSVWLYLYILPFVPLCAFVDHLLSVSMFNELGGLYCIYMQVYTQIYSTLFPWLTQRLWLYKHTHTDTRAHTRQGTCLHTHLSGSLLSQ